MKELKGATGFGQHQVTRDARRVERSVAISVMAYLLLLKCRAQDTPAKDSWSAFTLKRNFARQVARAQLGRSVEQRLRKGRQAREAA
jgi:hypothetical protein